MRLANLVELKDSGGLCLIDPSGCLIHDGLKRNVRDWKLRSTENKAAKKGEVNSAWHLKQRVEGIHRIKATEPSRKAHTSTSAQHAKRIHEGGVAYKIQHRVNLFSFRNNLREIWSFNLRSMSSKLS